MFHRTQIEIASGGGAASQSKLDRVDFLLVSFVLVYSGVVLLTLEKSSLREKECNEKKSHQWVSRLDVDVDVTL